MQPPTINPNDNDHPQWTHADWLAEAARRFGPDTSQWQFVCPMCKNVATPADFAALGADGFRASAECIGRVIGTVDGKPARAGETTPCDWAAFGLFSGPVSVTDDSGRVIRAFRFAPAVEQVDA